ncbi:MAG: amidohydrolase family protein, partial [Actinobacteria bacterium]|nr:amidohydrolase family protein [Actinomycetota bacterium]
MERRGTQASGAGRRRLLHAGGPHPGRFRGAGAQPRPRRGVHGARGQLHLCRTADGALRLDRGRGERALRVHGRPRRPDVPRRSAGTRGLHRERTVSYDLIVRGGDVVDGTGLPRRRVDVGVRDGRIVKLARLGGESARDEIDASGMIVAPGIVDVHTHYDPQITFDPYATMSCFHGVTTVVAGNCGFSLAPCKPEDRAFLTGIFARVENMDPIALSAITWDE